MDIKPRPNHRRHLAILRAMTPAQRLEKSFELTEFSHQLMKDGIRNRHPDATETEVHNIYLQRRFKFLARKTARERHIARLLPVPPSPPLW